MQRGTGGGRRDRVDHLRRLLRTPGRRREGIRASREFARQNIDDAAAIRIVADGLTAVGEHIHAIQACNDALARTGPHAGLLCSLGLALLAADRAADALAAFSQAAQLDPRRAEPRLRIGQALTRLLRFQPAIASLREAAAINRGDFETEFALGVALQGWGRAHLAVPHFRAALALRPESAEAAAGLGLALRLTGEFEASLEAYESAARCEPDSPSIRAGIAETLIAMNRTDEARRVLEPALSGPVSPAVAAAYARLARKAKQISPAIELCRECIACTGIHVGDRVTLLYSLGSLYEEAGDNEAAFDAFEEANSYYPADQFRAADYRGFVDRLIATFDPERLSGLSRSGSNSEMPIFIVGVPRSGTSLVEQILAAHADVFGAGELQDVPEIFLSLPERLNANADYPECLAAATPDILRSIADEHLEHLGELGGGARFVTDKLPGNFQHLGLIWMLFPHARIIHCRRDPLDTCLSCFTTMLPAAHSYSHDLRNLGLFYREHDRLMKHWRTTLDLRLLEVRYEDVVADPEPQTRRLLDFCGLPWDDACLRFHESRRVALTASIDQVRRPIYRTSVSRAARFGARLDPLRRALAGES